MLGSSRQRLLVGCGALSAACVGLVAWINLAIGVPSHDYLVWNLVLAWVPLVSALAIEQARGVARRAWLLALWLAFLPNAPYLVTDLVHLGAHGRAVPPVLDAATLAVAAVTGLVLGFSSVALVERRLRETLGRFATAVSLGALALASVGVYFGRVLRLNSWDLLARPRLVLAAVAEGLLDPQAHPLALTGTLALAAFLVVSYLAFRRGLASRPQRQATRAPR